MPPKPPITLKLGNPKFSFTIVGTHLVCNKDIDEHPFNEFIAGMGSTEFEETVYWPLNYTIFKGTTLSFSDVNTLAKHLDIKRHICLKQIFVKLKAGNPETEFNISRHGFKFFSDDTMKFYDMPRLRFEEMCINNPRRGVRFNGIELRREEMDNILYLLDLVTHFRKS